MKGYSKSEGKMTGGGGYKHTVKTDRGTFTVKGGQGLDNQAMNKDSPAKGFDKDGPSGRAGGYSSK